MSYLSLENVTKHYPVQKSLVSQLFSKQREFVHAVDGINLGVEKGEIYGLVGESGSGKTTTGRMTSALEFPTSGKVLLGDVDTGRLKGASLRGFRKKAQYIFQDPLSSLNPKMTVGDAVAEPLRYLTRGGEVSNREATLRMLDRVGLSPSESFYWRYPHELSGGQRQRVVIAKALVVEPDYVVADEPVAMVDISVRAQIMDLLLRMRKEFNLTILLITHDLAVANYMCDRMSVMYIGKIIETGTRDQILSDPKHPYTKALLAAVPVPDPRKRGKREVTKGEIPSTVNPPSGCRFHPRCPYVFDRCRTEEPALKVHGSGQPVACHLYDESGRGPGPP